MYDILVLNESTVFPKGNLSKWMMTPQGIGFLWVHPKHQASMSPLVTSHDENSEHFIDRFYSMMTKDMIPHVLVKDAVNFFKDLGGLVCTKELIAIRHMRMKMKPSNRSFTF